MARLERKRGGRGSAIGTLLVLMMLPLWPLAAQMAGLRSTCVDITELQFRPPSADQGGEDSLEFVQAGIRKGTESICTDVDGYRKSVLEEEWNRITLLKVKLRGPDGTTLTAVPSDARSPFDFYAAAIHQARVARRQQLLKKAAMTEGLILSLAGLACCARYWYEHQKLR